MLGLRFGAGRYVGRDEYEREALAECEAGLTDRFELDVVRVGVGTGLLGFGV